MKYYLAAALALGFVAVPLGAEASETIAVLDVHHAGCALRGPIVKRTLEHVKGVKVVRVEQVNGDADVTAMVTFDDTVTKRGRSRHCDNERWLSRRRRNRELITRSGKIHDSRIRHHVPKLRYRKTGNDADRCVSVLL